MKDRKLWEKRLGSIKNFKESVNESKDLFDGLPDGRYEAKVSDSYMAESKNKRAQIIVKGEIINHEELEGQPFTSFLGLEGDSLPFTLSTLSRLGYEVSDRPEEILDIIENLAESGLKVKINVKEGFANVVGALEDVAEVEAESEDAEDAEDVEETEEQEETEEAEEETSEISEGSKVTWKDKTGNTRTGEVVEILEESNEARIEVEGGKIVRVSVAKLSLEVIKKSKSKVEKEEVEEDEEETPEEPQEEGEEEEDGEPKTKSKTSKKTKSKEVKKVKKFKR